MEDEGASQKKVFAWQSCHNSLPYFQNLQCKQVPLDGKCIFCAAYEEDITHALFYYPSVRNYWTTCLPWIEEFEHPLHFQDLILKVFHSKKVEGLTTFFVIV